MGERKVLNKYFPPDFDPSQLPKGSKPKNGQIKVRVMLPMSIQCNSCKEYIYRGKKFNARKEDAVGEDYLGIRIFRFYIHCTNCSAEICFKTDPKNGDYVAEAGAQRNFEPWRQQAATEDEIKAQKEADEKNDSMRKLENRTIASKREMEILDALEEIREKNSRLRNLDTASLLNQLAERQATVEAAAEEADEQLVRAYFGGSANAKAGRLAIEDPFDATIDGASATAAAAAGGGGGGAGGGDSDSASAATAAATATAAPIIRRVAAAASDTNSDIPTDPDELVAYAQRQRAAAAATAKATAAAAAAPVAPIAGVLTGSAALAATAAAAAPTSAPTANFITAVKKHKKDKKKEKRSGGGDGDAAQPKAKKPKSDPATTSTTAAAASNDSAPTSGLALLGAYGDSP